jgi:hypothetical protein
MPQHSTPFDQKGVAISTYKMEPDMSPILDKSTFFLKMKVRHNFIEYEHIVNTSSM